MKPINFFGMLLLLALLAACQRGPQEAADTGLGGYLDSTYVSKTYRATMDSIHHSSGISEEDFKALQGFMRDYRDSIQGAPTYRSLLASAQGINEMKDGLSLKVESMNLHHVQKIVEIRLVLAIQNNLDEAISKAWVDIGWLDGKGKKLCNTPAFAVAGPIAPGASIGKLRLEYTMYKPTGNELNDPRQQAARDTLEMLEDIAKGKDLNGFKLRVHDLQLACGLRPAQFWLMPKEERLKLQDLPAVPENKRPQLLKWVEQNEPLIERLKDHSSALSLAVIPVITERVEASHGKNLLLDRIGKVRDYFIIQKLIPGSNINTAVQGKVLLKEEILDYWNWPMEIRIYEKI